MPQRPRWTSEAVRRFWDQYATDPRNADNYFTSQVGLGIAKLVASVVPRGRVLDFGCGVGYLAEHLIAAGYTVQGVDQSEASRAAAERRCGAQEGWMGATADASSLPGESFDVVTCVETVEHLDDEALTAVLSEIRRLLAPGGVAVFTTPNDEKLEECLSYCPFCDSEFHSVQHVRSWTSESLTAALDRAGFEVKTCGPTDLRLWQPFFTGQWLHRQTLHVVGDRLSRRAKAFRAGPHLVAIASARR